MHLHIISRADAKRAGLKYYFTGKACPKGHIEPRRVDSGSCVQCALAASTAYKKNNPDAIRAYKAEYEKLDSNKKYRREYRQKNKAAIATYNRNYHKENAERIAARRKAYNVTGKDVILWHSRNARAKRRNAEGHHTKEDIQRILKDQKHKCANCLCDVSGGYHVDHIMPLKLGGTNWPDNLQILCPTCNLRKNAKHPIDWAQENGRLL